MIFTKAVLNSLSSTSIISVILGPDLTHWFLFIYKWYFVSTLIFTVTFVWFIAYHYFGGICVTMHIILRVWIFLVCLINCETGLPGKESACQAGDMGSNPVSGRYPGEENGNQLQYSCLGNPNGLVGYSPWGHKRVRHDFSTKQQQQRYRLWEFCFWWVT